MNLQTKSKEPSRDANLWILKGSDTLIRDKLIPRRYKTLGLQGKSKMKKFWRSIVVSVAHQCKCT